MSVKYRAVAVLTSSYSIHFYFSNVITCPLRLRGLPPFPTVAEV